MAENVARTTVKQGMKAWIIANDWVRSRVAQLREDVEDTVAEARQEYERQTGTTVQPHPDPERRAGTTDSVAKTLRASTRHTRRTEIPGEASGTQPAQAV